MSTIAALDDEARYRAVSSRDRRFDGMFYTAVRSTGIYCRPSCPARTPARANVSFHRTAAAAQAAGYRACRRCLPDATPGCPDWDVNADLAGRAMRLIGDGVIDRDGVPGLARRLGYSDRHLARLLTEQLGAGPLALARAQRAQTARILIETTDLRLVDIAFAAGFASLRQFNDTIRQVYAATPTQLRGRAARPRPDGSWLHLRLGVRAPFAGTALASFLAARAVSGVEVVDPSTADSPASYARTMRLPRGPAVLRIGLPDRPPGVRPAQLPLELWLSDLRDLTAALARARRLVDADADPVAVDGALSQDPLLRPLQAAVPGIRVPGTVDGDELALRAVVGQQISVAGARGTLARLAAEHGEPVATPVPGLTRLPPTCATLAELAPQDLPMPRRRAAALIGLAGALAAGDLALDRSQDRDRVQARLLALPGIGPWTAQYVALRALGHPDVLLDTDLGTRRALARLTGAATAPRPAEIATRTRLWRPWRSYAQIQLWHSLTHPILDQEQRHVDHS